MRRTQPAPGLESLRREVQRQANPKDAEFLQRFFKTGPGEYGEADQFLGIRVPAIRKLVREYRSISHEDAVALLKSAWHEERLLALLLLAEHYRTSSPDEREVIHRSYLAHTGYINNWDLVDSSAAQIVGAHLDPRDIGLLERLARSESIWERRIAIIATLHWIKQGVFEPTLRIAELLLHDTHDLIHKAVGWMLREVGNRDREREEGFLRAHYQTMPRTMLRYAIEKFDEPLRQQYLRGEL